MSLVLHRAPWLATGFPGHDQPALLEDGGVLIENNMITKVGPYSELVHLAHEVKDHESCILTPALINCHSHLELSWMADKAKLQSSSFKEGDFVGWIRNLLSLRALDPEANIIKTGIVEAQKQMHSSGTGYLLDTGNDSTSRDYIEQKQLPTTFLLEFLGLTGKSQDDSLERLACLPKDTVCTPHAPYSTGPALLKRLKNRSSSQNQLFSIHTAESNDEIEFLKNGAGPFKDFLIERGIDLSSFSNRNTSPVHYLNGLGLLDEKTLCVHCVHLEQDEIKLLAECKVNVCLCPGSNRYLGVGKAPVPDLLNQTILPALGTDSLASNTSLSIWEEMRILQEDWPTIDPKIIFSMATYGGNQVLGFHCNYGLLAPGQSPRFLAVATPTSLKENDIFPFLTTVGESVRINWVEG